jgi:hemolysin III
MADAIIHVIGVAAALIAVPTMITLAALWSSAASTIAAATVYGISLIAMLTFSACYHMIRNPGTRDILRRLDHAAIFVLIAGTYTPFAVLLAGTQAASILIGIWGAALTGLVLKLAAPNRLEGLAVAIYLAMGWSVVVIGGPILDEVSSAALVLMLIGGGLYTLGVVFHLWQRLAYHKAIWHGMVLVASVVFYAAVVVEVTRAAGG